MRLSVLVVVGLLVSAPFLGQDPDDGPPNPCPGRGNFSCEAIDISDFTGMAGTDGHKNPLSIASPDGKKKIKVCCQYDKDRTPEISVVVGRKSFSTVIGYLADAEVAWAPDSLAFAETHTPGRCGW